MQTLFGILFLISLCALIAYSAWSLFVSIRDFIKRRKEKKQADEKVVDDQKKGDD